jgi:hypothetical protein
LNAIIIFAVGDEDVLASFRAELFHDERSREAGSARDDDTLVVPK